MLLIKKYFQLNSKQEEQIQKLPDLYKYWNKKINIVSRKDIDNLEERHILHSLAIAKFVSFKKGTTVLDLGCGGGFPGIILAIYFPEVTFHLIDARNKKILVVNDIITQLGLNNAIATHGRAEELKNEKFDFIVTRAVAKVDTLKLWTSHLFSDIQKNVLPNGIIALKGNIEEEINRLNKSDYYETKGINQYFSESYFNEKYILYIQY